jgi:protein-disulfide isomerase
MEAVGPKDHVRGATGEHALTVVVYGDYDCPHTRASQAVVDRLVAENADLRVVFRHFPLRHIHANAEILSRIAEASAAQGKFWEMHDHLMHHRSAIGQADVLADAKAVGVDLDAVSAALDGKELAARIEHDVQSGRASGVHSTPSFFFDGVLHDGHYDHETLAKKLAEARARKKS